MQCIVHYYNQSSYSDLKRPSVTNSRRIKRIEIGGECGHAEQYSMIPEPIDIELHGINLEPCYKRYDL